MHQQNMALVSGLDIDNRVSAGHTLFDSHTRPLQLNVSMPKPCAPLPSYKMLTQKLVTIS